MIALLSACAPKFVSLDPVRNDPQLLPGHFVTTDGLSLPYRNWRTDEAPKAVIIALHGFNDYSRFFDPAGQFLAKHGITSYAFDQRGFGAGAFRGRWFPTENYIDDIAAFSRAIAETYDGTPVYVLGASMGGAIAMTFAAERSPDWIDGVILSAPAVWGRQSMPWYQTAVLDLTAAIAPGMRLTGRGLKITPSDNRDMLLDIGRDPLVIKGSRVDTLYGLVDLMGRALDASAELATPALILYGAKDEIIREGPTRMMWQRLPESVLHQRVVYPDGYHMLLRDLQAETVWTDIAHWINDPNSPLPSREIGSAVDLIFN